MKKIKIDVPSYIILFLYWFILVVWQNIAHSTARSSLDSVIKILLLVMLTVYFVFRHHTISQRNFLTLLFLSTAMVFTFINDTGVLGFSTVISYLFPLLFIFLTYCMGNDEIISESDYFKYLDLIVCVVLYMALYSFIFETDKFTNWQLITTAYSNELSSFLVSNLEYGMYLTFAVYACIINLSRKPNLTVIGRCFYYLCMVIFFINLIFTFSRTSILASVAMMLIYALFTGNNTRKIVIPIVIVFVTIYWFNPTIQEFVQEIVLKNGTSSGRDVLLEVGLNHFKEASLYEKLFGMGYSGSLAYIREATSHGSLHNGYMQLLTTNGIVGLTALIAVLVVNMIANIRFIKTDRFFGTVFLGLSILPVIFMLTNTSIVFYSSIDSSMLTLFTILVPKYVRNYYMTNQSSGDQK